MLYYLDTMVVIYAVEGNPADQLYGDQGRGTPVNCAAAMSPNQRSQPTGAARTRWG